MTGIALKNQWGKLIASVQPYDGIILLVGFLGFIALWTIESVGIRWICSIIVAVSAILSIASLQTKRVELRRGFRSRNSFSPSQEEGSNMKKLVFDDFHPHRATPIIEEKQDQEDLRTHQERVPSLIDQPPLAGHPISARRLDAVSTKTSAKLAPQEYQISDFFDLDSDVFRSSALESGQPELRHEFDFLLNKVLAVIKEVVFAHTVAFFWANREKQHMVCEAKVTDGVNFIASKRFTMGQDIVSQIAHKGKPELINRVNPLSEKELLRYYEQVEYVKSFVGVPVFYPPLPNEHTPSEPVGVIIVDSTVEDAFGPETISLLGQFTKLVSALIKTSTDKYDLLLDVELLNAIRRLQERVRNDFSVHTIAQTLAEEVGKLLNWDFLSVVLNDEVKRAWVAKKIVNRIQEGYIGPEQLVDFGESIVGNAIKNNTHRLVQDLEIEQLPRYYRGEKLGSSGSFVSVPISSLNKCYGALNIESRDKFNFSRRDVEILYRLAENAASALEILYMNDIIKEYVIMDDLTGVYLKKFFLKKLSEELLRADDYGTDISLLLFTVDHANRLTERYGQEGFENVLIDVAKVLRSGVRPYDIIGRYDYNRFSVVLVNTTANDAYIWAEKIRKTIASRIINVDGKSFSVTITAGVCGALEGMKTDEILGHASAVLHKGMEAGGNTVRIY